jgi:hypothetical protein
MGDPRPWLRSLRYLSSIGWLSRERRVASFVATEQSGAKSTLEGEPGFGAAAVELDRYGFVPFSWSIVDTPTNTGAVCTFFPETDQVALSAGNLLRLTNTATEQPSVGMLTSGGLYNPASASTPTPSATVEMPAPTATATEPGLEVAT